MTATTTRLSAAGLWPALDSAPTAPKVLCSLGLGYHADFLAASAPTFHAYGERHGYDVRLFTDAPDLGRPAAWSKVPLIRRLLDHYELVLWIDADAIVVDPSEDVATVLAGDDLMAMCTHHFEGEDRSNTGVWLFRSNAEVLDVLDDIWSNDSALDHPWWEQAAFLELLGYDVSKPGRQHDVGATPLRSRVRRLDRRWNSILEDHAAEPMIRHYPGRPLGDRARALATDLTGFVRRHTPRPDNGWLNATATSVVVVLPDGAWEALAVLESFAAAPQRPAWEWIVVAGSDAPSADVLPAVEGDGVQTVLAPPGSSVAERVTQGIALAHHDVLLVADGAATVEESTLDELLWALAPDGVAAATAQVADAAVTNPVGAPLVAVTRASLPADLPLALAGAGDRAIAAVLLTAARRGTVVHAPAAVVHLVDDDSVPVPRLVAGPRAIEELSCREELPLLLNNLGLRGRGIEVGVQRGLFSAELLTAWEGTELVSIDPWLAAADDDYIDIANVSQDEQDLVFAECADRLQVFGARSMMWRLTSVEAAEFVADHSLDFAYLDARHDYASVVEDLEAWFGKVRPGGVFGGHDYVDGLLPEGDFGVQSAVDEFFTAKRIAVHATRDEPWISWVVRIPE